MGSGCSSRTQARPIVEPDAEAKAAPNAEVEAIAETKAEAKAEPKAKGEANAEPKAEANAEPNAKLNAEPELESRHPIDIKWEKYEVPRWDFDTGVWEFHGGKKIEALLEHTDLVDLRYIIENAEAGRPVPRWQDVPRGAKINAANAHRIKATGPATSLIPGLAILVLSYPWLDPEHPDKELSTMRRLLPIMKAFLAGIDPDDERSTVGLLMDYPCLPQKGKDGTDGRSEEEKARFKKGLETINQWYLHPRTTVIVYDVEMPGQDSGFSNLRPHSGRGWCAFELRASSLVKAAACLWSLKGFEDGGSKPQYLSAMDDAVKKVVRPVPMDPDSFGEVLRTGVRTGELAFTAKADLQVVADQYAKAFEEAYAEAESLYYYGLGWGDTELNALASALARAKEAGGLTRLWSVYVNDNPCSEAGLIPLVEALRGTGCELKADSTKCTEAGTDAVRKAAKGAGVQLYISCCMGIPLTDIQPPPPPLAAD